VCKRRHYEDARLTTPAEGSAITKRMMEAVCPEVVAEHEARHNRLDAEREQMRKRR
jgi:hypothetical protein